MTNKKVKSILMLSLGLGLVPLQSFAGDANSPDASRAAIQRLVSAGEIRVTPRGELLVSPNAYAALKKVAPVPEDQLLNYLEGQLQSEPLIDAAFRGAVL
jgi:hypothetical protein